MAITRKQLVACDACGRDQGEVEAIVSLNKDGSIAICQSCVWVCVGILTAEKQEESISLIKKKSV
jgi:ATP-dependent protease Clp ATPase subunit